jgi:hypothetical protein
MMEFINESNMDYESELQRNPLILRTWLDYLTASNASSYQVCVDESLIFSYILVVSDLAI